MYIVWTTLWRCILGPFPPQPAIALMRQWDRLVEEDGVLFHQVFRSDGREDFLQLVLLAVLKQETLHQLHQKHGHQGLERTFELDH